jgi:phage host-nuclease inhibitor protein Gam
MAKTNRVRIPDAPPPMLGSWEEVDAALAAIGEANREVTIIETVMNEEIDRAKDAAVKSANPHRERIDKLEQQVKTFADANKADFGARKTKDLTFGSLGYRKSTEARVPTGKKLAEVIKKLLAKGMSDCVVTPKQRVDKDKLKAYSAEDVEAVGATLKVEDNFWYEVKREEVSEA